MTIDILLIEVVALGVGIFATVYEVHRIVSAFEKRIFTNSLHKRASLLYKNKS